MHRGLYVTDGATAATDPSAGDKLINRIQAGRFDTVVLYGLAPILGDPARVAGLLSRLRSTGVITIAAPVGSMERVQQIVSLRSENNGARFDALITELEYWNQCHDTPDSTDALRSDCFPEMQALVTAMRTAAPTTRLGAYLGAPTRDEVTWLKGHLDFAFLDYPIRTPTDVGRRESRLDWCAAAGLEVWPILYTRGEVPMQPWLCEHSLAETERSFLGSLASARPIAGFQYFADDGFQ